MLEEIFWEEESSQIFRQLENSKVCNEFTSQTAWLCFSCKHFTWQKYGISNVLSVSNFSHKPAVILKFKWNWTWELEYSGDKYFAPILETVKTPTLKKTHKHKYKFVRHWKQIDQKFFFDDINFYASILAENNELQALQLFIVHRFHSAVLDQGQW